MAAERDEAAGRGSKTRQQVRMAADTHGSGAPCACAPWRIPKAHGLAGCMHCLGARFWRPEQVRSPLSHTHAHLL